MQLLDQAQLAASFRFPQSTALLSLRPIRQSVSTQVLEADPFDLRAGDEWDRSLAAAPDAHIFQTSAWANVLIETYGHVAVFRRYTAGGKIIALFPLMEVASRFSARRGVSVPFSDLGGPAILQSKPGLHTALIDDLIGLARDRHWKFIELRGELPGRETLPPYQTVWAHALNLSQSTEALFENCGSAFRRGVRKAEASGVTTEISISLDAVRAFYGLQNRTRRRHGIPPQPYAFFANIQRHILERGLGYIVLARRAGRAIAGAMFFYFNGNGLFKFGASDERHLEHRANNLVMWDGIREAVARGVGHLHLGRTDLGHDGLRRFKLSLGATEKPLHYYRFDLPGQRWVEAAPNKARSLSSAVFRRLPLTLNQLAGTVLYPHLH